MARMACVCIRHLEIWPRFLGNFEKLVTELGLGGEYLLVVAVPDKWNDNGC
jgi:hypothetical protein